MTKDNMDAISLVRKAVEQEEGDVLREGTYHPDWLLENRCRAEQGAPLPWSPSAT